MPSTASPLRILYDHTVFTRYRHGGIARYFSEIIPRITQDPAAKALVYMGFYIHRHGVESHRKSFAAFGGRRRPNVRKTHRIAEKLGDWGFARFARKHPADIYHPTDYTELMADLGTPRVLTVHDFVLARLAERPAELLKPMLGPIRRAQGLICVSESTRRDLIELTGTPSAKVKVIHHGNSLRGVTPAPQTPLASPYLLYVGTRHGYKNAAMLMKAYAASSRLRSDFQLLFYGGGPWRAEESQQLRELGIEDRVKLIPAGNDALLAASYAHAAVFVYPSLYEGFGIPILEAMGFRCPVAASNTSSLPEVGSDAALYFDPRNADDMVQTIERIVFDSANADALRAAGVEREAGFSWEACAKSTLEFYREVAGGSY